MKAYTNIRTPKLPSKVYQSWFKRAFQVVPLLALAVSPLQFASPVFAAEGEGQGGGNNQSRILIQPVAPTTGETISGSYTIRVDTPLVPTDQSTLKYCLRAGEETTELTAAVQAMAESEETTDLECVWANLTPNGATSWQASLNTNAYDDGLYTMPLLLKSSGVSGQKYAFVKNIVVSNNVSDTAAPVVALQTINVSHASRPTDAPIRGTALVQAKITDTDLASHQLTVTPSDEAGTPTGATVYDSGNVSQTTNLAAFTTVYEWDTTIVPDGNYVVVLTAKDAAGHESTTTLLRKVDNIKGGEGSDPAAEEGEVAAIEPIQPLSDGYISGSSYLVQVKVTDPTVVFDSMVLRLQSGSGGGEEETATTESSDASLLAAAQGGESQEAEEASHSPWLRLYYNPQTSYWEYQLDTTLYTDGLYWMHVRAVLESGTVVTEVSTSLRITNLTVDNTLPIVTLDQGDETTKTTIHRQGIAQDNSGIASYQWSQLSGTGHVTFSQPNEAASSMSANANGKYIVQLAATDLAGNVGTASFALTWFDPALVPVVTVTSTPTTSETGLTTPAAVTVTSPSSTTPSVQLAVSTTTDPPATSDGQVLGADTTTAVSDVAKTFPDKIIAKDTSKSSPTVWYWVLGILGAAVLASLLIGIYASNKKA